MSLLSSLMGKSGPGAAQAVGTTTQDADLPAPPRGAGGYSPLLGGDFSHGPTPNAAYAALPPLFHPAYQEFSDSSSPEEAIARWNAAGGQMGNSQAPAQAPPQGGAPLGGGVSGVFQGLADKLNPSGSQ